MLKIARLTVNHFAEAIGLDEAPRFSWVLESDVRDARQTAYRLQIAANDGFESALFDSGEILSGNRRTSRRRRSHPCPSALTLPAFGFGRMKRTATGRNPSASPRA